MDKGKSRTDLLAAGRKKLQQFRQKKDNKSSGSQGKSLKKSSKPEEYDADPDSVSTSARPTSGSQVSEGEHASNADSVIGVVSHSTESSVAEIDSEAFDPLAAPTKPESCIVDTAAVHGAELPSHEVGASECVDSSVLNAAVVMLETSDILDTVEENKCVEGSISSHQSTHNASVVATESMTVGIEVEGGNDEEDSLASREKILQTLLIQRTEGAMQEPDGLDSKQSDESGEIELEGPSFDVLGGRAESLSRSATTDISVNEGSTDVKKTGEADAESASKSGDVMSDSTSASMVGLAEADGNFDSSGAQNGYNDDSEGMKATEVYTQLTMPENDKEWMPGSKMGSSYRAGSESPIANLRTFSLLQLTEVIRGLCDEEFEVILKSRELVSKSHLANFAEDGFQDLLDRLQEELTLAILSKNIFHLQIAEHSELELEFDCQRQQLVDQLSLVNMSLNEACQRNQILFEELAQCRCELQAALGGRHELEKQFLIARAEVDEISARAHELENSLDRSQGDFTRLLTELDYCKHLNESLNETIVSETADKKKFVEEKKFYLHENEKLSAELSGCKSLLAALEAEKSNFVGNMSSVKEDKKKLEQEMVHLSQENERLSLEFVDCNSLANGLQIEMANLQKSFALSIEERTKLEEEKDSLSRDNEILSSDLLVLHERLSTENAKCMSFENDLNEAKMRLEQLAEENIFLNQSLNAYKAKIGEIDVKAHIPSLAGETGKRAENSAVVSMGNRCAAEDHSLQSMLKQDGSAAPVLEISSSAGFAGAATSDSSFEFGVLKQNFEEADRMLQNLEEAVEGMQLHSTSFMSSGGKLAAPGVSKLIQAFESKVNVDEQEIDEHTSTENQSPTDPFVLSKELTGNLRAVLLQLQMDAQSAYVLFMEEQNARKIANATIVDLKDEYDALEEHSYKMMAVNIELEVLFEAMKLHTGDAGARITELEVSTESLKQEQFGLKVANGELTTRLCGYETRITELMIQLSDLQQSSNEMASLIGDQLDKLKREAIDRALILERDWSSFVVQMSETVGKLDKYVGKGFSSIHTGGNNEVLVMSTYVTASVDGAIKVIEDLKEKLEDARTDRETISTLYKEVNEKYDDLHGRNELAVAKLHHIYGNLQKLIVFSGSVSGSDMDVETENMIDQLDYRNFEILLKQLENLLGERKQQRMIELTDLQEKIHESNILNLQQENEILLLRETLSQAEEALIATRTELKEKVVELEQSEQRVSSIREKLSLAVAKGKGLIVQRDSLRQSLVEKSSELERCLQELQFKDVRLHEIETKLKAYSEAGERVEALESELSYIRNSATALRESFLLKDSVLQRIEEVLEDLELPEHFHSKDIIEKIDWLARSAAGNSLPLTDWDQKSSPAGGSYSDAGFIMDYWKDEVQPSANTGDDLRRKYEELQSKFYGLAEQNEMLEQSLMERNNLVQRWEELLDRINMPSHLRFVEPEDRIEWLGRELSEAHVDRNSLLQRIDHFENLSVSLTSDLEESRIKFSSLHADFEELIHDRELLSQKLEILSCENEKLLVKAVQRELDNEIIQNEVNRLQEDLDGTECKIRMLQDLVNEVLHDPVTNDLVSGSGIVCLEGLVRKLVENYMVMHVPGNFTFGYNTKEVVAVNDAARVMDTPEAEKLDTNVQKKELDDTLLELMNVREERDRYMGMQQSLILEVENLDKKRMQLQELLNQEELKSASAREKLNVAVRKGKSLVQQRDNLKQTIESMTNELGHLKSEIKHNVDTLADYEQKLRDLSAYPERVQALESESLLLKNILTKMEHALQEKGQSFSMLLNALRDIDVGGEVNSSDPIEKLKEIGKLCYDLQAAVASSEQVSQKSKRAAQLLLAELNEVQERNDGFQEELAKASHELAELTKERDIAEASKLEALSRLEKLSLVHSEERNSQLSEFLVLKSCTLQLRETFSEVNYLIAGTLSQDLDLLHNLNAGVELCIKKTNLVDLIGLPLFSASGVSTSWNSANEGSVLSTDTCSELNIQGLIDENVSIEDFRFVGRHLKELITEIGALKEVLHKHPTSLQEEARSAAKSIMTIHRELISRKESVEALERDVSHMESIRKEKEIEVDVLCKNIALLYEACTSSVFEIEQRKAELVGSNLAAADMMSVETATSPAPAYGQADFSSEESLRCMAEKMLFTVRDFVGLKAEILYGSQKEMKLIIENLQKELQEKDMQKERICTELVNQIRKAEAIAKSYFLDLQSSKTQLNGLEKMVKDLEEKRNQLEQRVEELQAKLASSTESEERVRSVTDVLAAKDHEIESLMQALDEEEVQMDDMSNKIKELEMVVKQKNHELESLETSRGKVMKKLAVTVSKFDELHLLSGGLLTEIERLQSQLQDRDVEISFLRQEVTRYANDVLVASQMNTEKNSGETYEFLTWFDTMTAQVGLNDKHHDAKDIQQIEYKEVLQKKVAYILSEIEDLRAVSQSKDDLLQAERRKVEELKRKEESLAESLHEMGLRLNMLEGIGDFERAASTSEISEVEPVIKKWAAPGNSVTPLVRSNRKSNTDQVAIAIDMDPVSGNLLEDEDDDKVHGFKSLTTSRIVPKFTRPVTDMIDGLWVSCDRALMRQPASRLGIIIYWAILHILLATFMV